MRGLSPALDRLIDAFGALPGIGEKTAERLAAHILAIPAAEAMPLAIAIRDVKKLLGPCPRCRGLSEGGPCGICADPGRDAALLCVVESVRELVAIERTGRFRGLYHVLGGRLSPWQGVGPEALDLPALRDRVRDGVKEVILALNPDAEGDLAALHVFDALTGLAAEGSDPAVPLVVSRLARGIPSGGSIDLSNVEILKDALAERRSWKPGA